MDEGDNLYINCVSCYGRIITLVAMTYFSQRLMMGKVEIDNSFYLNWNILNLVLQKCFFSSPLRFIGILSTSLNLISCHCDKNGKFSKMLQNLLLKNIRGTKLIICIHVYDIRLYINYVFVRIR